jgi:hypothetical protein
MSSDSINSSFNVGTRDMNYLSKDFNSFKRNLVDYAKSYFPTTYKDFSENSTGMMFIELASYVGDVLSYYIDYQFKEGFMQYAEERKNVVTLANYLGYRITPARASTTELEIFQLIPAKIDGNGKNIPDNKYAVNLKEGMEIGSSDAKAVIFRTLEPVNFAENTLTNPTRISVFERDASGQPTLYLLKKEISASSGTLVTRRVDVGTAQEFLEVELIEDNILEIISVSDTEGNKYYEVPYISQDTILIDEHNNEQNTPNYTRWTESVPYVLRLLRTSRRFTATVNSDNSTTLEFGAGVDKFDDEIIIPNMDNVGRVLKTEKFFEVSYDPSNFLKTKSYGEAPANTTLIIQYYVGGGIESNVKSNSLTSIMKVQYGDDNEYLTTDELKILGSIKKSVTVNNPEPALGGRGAESTDEIRINALANFSTQNRAVTREDYIVRSYSMPNKFGSVAKAYVSQDGILDQRAQLNLIQTLSKEETKITPAGLSAAYGELNNPFAINMYVLSYDKNRRLVNPNELIMKNLRTYIGQYRLLTDGINITSAFVINVGVDFEISVYQNYNKREVLFKAIDAIKEFFDIGRWQITQPIEVGDLEIEITKVSGVKSIVDLRIKNLNIKDGDYSENEYDIAAATINKVIHPSMDPSIFELKYPTKDISGRVS